MAEICVCGHLIWDAQKLVDKGNYIGLEKPVPPRMEHTNQEAGLLPNLICATCGCIRPLKSSQKDLEDFEKMYDICKDAQKEADRIGDSIENKENKS